MDKFSKINLVLPFLIIISCSSIIFGVRYLDVLTNYEFNLTFAQPIIGFIYILVIYFSLLVRKKMKLSELGLRPNRVKFTVSLILGGLGGIFFFMVYFGAHPNRHLPPWSIVAYFNIYYIFFLFAEELIFRIWAINFFTRVLSLKWSILLSAVTYTIAALATIGRDPSSVVSGEIDFFIVFETIFRSMVIGTFLAGIYCFTKSIYGNIFFNLISTIPILYEENGHVTNGNLISALISVICFLIFLILVIINHQKRIKEMVKKIAQNPDSTKRLPTKKMPE